MNRARRPLLVSHDFSYSGAPIALLSLSRALNRIGLRPRVASLAGGPLKREFLKSDIEVVQRVMPDDVSFAIANTVEAIPAALRMKAFGVPVGAWVHESGYFFDLLGIEPAGIGLEQLDLVLAPSSFQLDELSPFVKPGTSYQLRNMVRQDYFRLGSDEPRLAVSGRWEERKGQAVLLELARESGVDCRFKFIGADEPPELATAYPRGQHVFLGQIDPKSSKRAIASASAIVSCAVEETQNLAAIEAIMAGRPALLSDIRAHRILATMFPNVILFDRNSADSFAAGLQRLNDMIPDESLGTRSSELARALFGEPAFEARLRSILPIFGGEGTGEVPHYQDELDDTLSAKAPTVATEAPGLALEAPPAALKEATCRYGRMVYFVNDPLIGRSLREYGEWAQNEVDLLLTLIDPGDVVLDVGAYIGTHTLALASKVGSNGKVRAFEPLPDHFSVLRKNVERNCPGVVELYNLGLSGVSNDMFAPRQDPSGNVNFGGTSLNREASDEGDYRIPTTTLDELALARCDFVKMDAEGMEAEILEGGMALLAGLRPIVYVECNSVDKAWPCVLTMRQLGYETRFFLFDAFNPRNHRQSGNNFLGSLREAGLLFFPRGSAKLPAPGVHGQSLLLPVESVEDLVLGMMLKPQYKWESLYRSLAAQTIGAGLTTGAIGLATVEAQVQLQQAQQEVSQLRAELEAERRRRG